MAVEIGNVSAHLHTPPQPTAPQPAPTTAGEPYSEPRLVDRLRPIVLEILETQLDTLLRKQR